MLVVIYTSDNGSQHCLQIDGTNSSSKTSNEYIDDNGDEHNKKKVQHFLK